MAITKVCTKCQVPKLLNEDNWYKARPTATHVNGGWQSYCKDCWKLVNRQNKQRRKNNLATTDKM